MLRYFEKQDIKNSVWLPNSREAIVNIAARKDFRKKFVFISTPSIYFNYEDRFNVSEDDELPKKMVKVF